MIFRLNPTVLMTKEGYLHIFITIRINKNNYEPQEHKMAVTNGNLNSDLLSQLKHKLDYSKLYISRNKL